MALIAARLKAKNILVADSVSLFPQLLGCPFPQPPIRRCLGLRQVRLTSPPYWHNTLFILKGHFRRTSGATNTIIKNTCIFPTSYTHLTHIKLIRVTKDESVALFADRCWLRDTHSLLNVSEKRQQGSSGRGENQASRLQKHEEHERTPSSLKE